MQLGAQAWPWLIAAVLSLSLAAWLASCGWRKPVIRALVIFLVSRAFFDVGNGFAFGGTGAATAWFLPVATLLLPGAALSFYAAYQKERGRRAEWGRFAWPISMLMAALFFIAPSLWFGTAQAGSLGPMVIVYGLIYFLYAALALDLGMNALEEDDLKRRRGLLWLGLGFAFLPAYVSFSDLLFIDVLQRAVITNVWLAISHWVSVAAGLLVFALFILLARDAIKTENDSAKEDVAWVLAVFVLPGVSVLALWGLDALNLVAVAASVGAEGFWSVIHPLFVALAVARFGAFGLDVRARSGLKWMLFVGLFPLAFGLGWMAGINSLPNQNPAVVATVFALLLAPFSKWLLEAANNWAGRILGIPKPVEDAA